MFGLARLLKDTEISSKHSCMQKVLSRLRGPFTLTDADSDSMRRLQKVLNLHVGKLIYLVHITYRRHLLVLALTQTSKKYVVDLR